MRSKADGELDERDYQNFLLQVADGARYLHGRTPDLKGLAVCHGDLKGENIFLTRDCKTVKIGDLESFHLLVEGKTCNSGLRIKEGTLLHMSPEMLRYAAIGDAEDCPLTSTGMGRATDIWSIGCVALEMFGNGEIRYLTQQKEMVQVQNSLVSLRLFWEDVARGARLDMSETYRKKISNNLREIVESCLQWVPKERPTADQLYEALSRC